MPTLLRGRYPRWMDSETPPELSTSIRVVPSGELSTADWSTLTDLCVAAFNEDWVGYWESIGPGVHVIAEHGERGIVAHAAIVDRLLYPGDATLRAGYVEAVAVAPDLQRHGLGTEVMEIINRMIDEGYELGALGTGRHGFYARLGWVVWRGPTWVRERDGSLQRSPDEDGDIMVRLTPMTPPDLDLSLPIAVDWRPGEEVW
jgi:aminoglycoside 2'-N-acetyltransferase I